MLSPRPCSLSAQLVCTLLVAFPTFLILAHFERTSLSLGSFRTALRGPSSRRRLSIWLPNQTCTGSFSSEASEYSDDAFPNALLRDIYLDNRPASQRHARHKHGPLPSQRIIIAVTAHLSVRIQNENVSVSIRNAPELRAHVDDVRELDVYNKGDGFEYAAGKKTKRGLEVYECQLIVTLQAKSSQSDFGDYVRSLADDPRVSVDLDIPLDRFDGKKLLFKPSFAMGCVFGWNAPKVISSRAPARMSDPSAILFCANSLSGNKKELERNHFEIAHWAARSLQGSVRFDMAVLPIVVDRSMSDCNMTDKVCLEDVTKQNKRLFERVADNVAAELNKIGISDDLYERIILIPFCRLGTHATGSERRHACSGSQRYGQHQITMMPYTLLGGYHKWAMLYDLDEYIATTDGKGPSEQQPIKAGVLFDKMLRESSHMKRAAFTIAWLNFRIQQSDVREITSELLLGRSQKLVSSTDADSKCYEISGMLTGKAVVRYDVGLGFVVHQPVVQISGRGMRHNMWQVSCKSERLRVWHARLYSNPLGTCVYAGKGRRDG